jgi:hypothetical protein|tara:strand:- start:4846 stop:5013 length:168 start_codon:yes stop_codon:yes gene_type:complete
MDPEKITLETTSRQFTYEKMSRDLDGLTPDELRDICKCYMKLYLKQQEVLKTISR